MALWLFASVGNAHAVADRIRLAWNDNPATTVVIAWDQTAGTDPVLRYDTIDHGRLAAAYRFETPPTRQETYRGMNNHFAKLEDLRSDTAYYFVIQDSDGVTDRLWFRTAPALNQPFTFIAGGETGTTADLPERARWSHRMVAKLRPLFVVFNGNFCSDLGTSDEFWQLWLTLWATETRTSDGRMFPLVPVMGEHEADDLTVLHNLFDVPYQNDDMTAVFYGIDIGHTLFHLTLLNSEVPVDGYQGAWLAHDLATHRGFEFTAVAYNRSIRPHTTVQEDQVSQYDAWAGVFYDYGVDLAFEGDSKLHKITFPIRPADEAGQHQGYIRDDLFGTMYLGEGSWGSETRAVDNVKPWTMTSGAFNQFKWLHVYPTTADEPGRIDVHTVVTGTVDGGEYEERVSGVGENGEGDVFAIPEGLMLADTRGEADAVTYPVERQLAGFSLQNGMNGYTGTIDLGLWENTPETLITDSPVAATVRSDLGATRQVVLKFTNIFGDLNWQVPWWCEVEQATLRLWVADGTAGPVSIHRLLVNWEPQATWQTMSGGINIDDQEASSVPDTTVKDIGSYAYHWFDVTDSLEYWRANIGTNRGWGIVNGGGDEMTFYTSEWSSQRHRPKLIVQCAVGSGEDPPDAVDTEAPDPAPVTVRRLRTPSEETSDETPPTVELAPATDGRRGVVTGCLCQPLPTPGTSLFSLLTMLFR